MTFTNENPFPGLRSFDYEENRLFFGREKHIQDLLKKLELHHFVAVVGTSGSGKSSLIRAGLLPAIHNGKLGNSQDQWLIASMKPGNTPLKNLADALMDKNVFSTGDAEKDKAQHETISQLINQSSLGLIQAVRNLITGNRRLLILVDQFEEIFRFADEGSDKNSPESNAFAQMIIDSVRQRDIPIYIVLTLRSDFLGDCVRFEGLPESINDGHYLVPRLNREQNKAAITGPVEYAKGKISPRLVQHVINDLGDNPDQLPVLQHALMRTWDKWTLTAEPGEPMDLRHYEMIGGMAHALSNHADEAYNELKSDAQRKLIEHIFKALTVKTGDNRGVRRPTSVKNLMMITGTSIETMKEALHPFRKSGRTFILPAEGKEITDKTVLDISHESLMRGWERLRTWVDEEMESAAIYDRLCTGALLYKEGRSALWRDPELQLAIDWKEKNNPNEAWSKQYNTHFNEAISFLEASKKERTNEINRIRKRRNIVRSAVTAFLVIVSILTVWAMFQTKKANENTLVAEQKTIEALNQKQLAEQAKEMALDASKKAMDAKSFAELQSNIAGQQTRLAEEQKSKAEQEAQRATEQQQEALKQKQIAEQKRLEALNQKQIADSSQLEANRLRMISISQNIAFKSIQQKEDVQLAALLACQSYKMSNENGGNINDQQLYNALYGALKKADPAFKAEVIRENNDVSGMQTSPKNISLLLADGKLNQYNTTNFSLSGQVKLSGLNGGINTLYLSNNGRFAAVGMDNNSAAIFDTKNPGKPQMLTGHSGLIRAVAFSEDGSMLATGGRDSSVIIWKNAAQMKRIRFNSRIKSIVLNGDESKLFIGCEDGTVSQYTIGANDAETFASLKGARVQSIQCSASSRIIAAGYSNGTIQVMNGKGTVTRTLNETGSVDYLLIDEKNDLLISATANKIIHIYRMADLSQKPVEINATSGIVALSESNGEMLYVACADKSIRSYPVNTSWFEKPLKAVLRRDFTNEEWNLYIGADVEKR